MHAHKTIQLYTFIFRGWIAKGCCGALILCCTGGFVQFPYTVLLKKDIYWKVFRSHWYFLKCSFCMLWWYDEEGVWWALPGVIIFYRSFVAVAPPTHVTIDLSWMNGPHFSYLYDLRCIACQISLLVLQQSLQLRRWFLSYYLQSMLRVYWSVLIRIFSPFNRFRFCRLCRMSSHQTLSSASGVCCLQIQTE